MDAPEVIFAPGLAEDAEIRSALRRIPPEAWPEAIDHIEVVRLLDGGLTGSTVAQVFLWCGPHRLLRVVKIGPAAELAAEWRAYREVVEPVRNALCAPIVAATREVTTGAAVSPWDGPSALVYDHVGQYAGAPEDEVATLEELARAAFRGSPGAFAKTVAAIGELFSGTAHVFYHRYAIHPAPLSLRFANLELGPNVTVTVDSLDGELLHHGPVDPGQARSARLADDEVLLRSVRGTGLRDGDLLTLGELRPHKVTRSGSLIARGDHIVVEIEPEHGRPNVVERLAERSSIAVCGRITATRTTTHRRRLWAVTGELDSDPFGALPQVLTESVEGRVFSPVHGDLNPRNVLCTAGRPYLIDYARAARDRPHQTDFCWLEIGLVRDVFAEAGLPALLGLQRALGFAAHLLDLGADGDRAGQACRDLVDTGLWAAFGILWAIREHAHRCYPATAGRPWRWDHPRQLLLAAHRTLKWTGDLQPAAKLCASAAAAMATTEWSSDPFRFWERDHLVMALRIASEVLPLDGASTRFYAELVTALESRGPLDEDSEELLRHRRIAQVGGRKTSRDPAYFDLTANGISALTVLTDRVALLAGGAGSGKTTVVRELGNRLTDRIPVFLSAAEEIATPVELLVLGAVHLIVDGIDQLGQADRVRVTASLRDLCDRYPRVALVVCLRHEGDEPELYGFPVVHLRPLAVGAMRSFLWQALSRTGLDVDHLLTSLLEDPSWHRLDPRRPAVLSAVARRLAAGGPPDTLKLQGIPENRGDHEFAAVRTLLAEPHRAAELARNPRWREPCVRFAAQVGDQGPVLDMVRTVSPEDPVFAARLLRAANADLPEFTSAQREMLGDPVAGPAAWRAAADALRELGNGSGRETLLASVLDSGAHEQARTKALRALAAAHEETLLGSQRRAASETLTSAVFQVLGDPAPAPVPLRVAVLEAAGKADVRGAELLISHCVDPAEPWEVIRQAVLALRDLGTMLPAMLREVYRASCRRRLAVVEGKLAAATVTGRLRAERAELVSFLAETEPLPWLLRRRFAFDLGDSVVDRLDELLTGAADPDLSLKLLDSDDPAVAAAAAHRLLRDTPGQGHDLLDRTGPDATAERLSIAAAAVRTAGPRGRDLAERLIRQLAPVVGADRIAGLAALVHAVFVADRARGTRLAWETAAILAERGLPERHRWPWVAALARSRGKPAELDAMLGADDAVATLAVAALASHDFHRSCDRGPRHAFSPAARHRLLDLRPALDHPSPEAVQWLLAAATVGATEALPVVEKLVTGCAAEWGSVTVETGSARFGVVTRAPLGDALAIAGYLARRTGDGDPRTGPQTDARTGPVTDTRTDAGTDTGTAAVHRLLREFDPRGRHASVQTGRLIGLAYLGDWQPLIAAFPLTGQGRTAARNALELWTPGPHTAPGGGAPSQVAAWIATLLEESDRPVARRWAWDELRRHALRLSVTRLS